MQIIQVTDPALIAEACRSKELDRTNPGNRALSIFAGPHGYPTLLTGPSDARWRVVRYVFICHPFTVEGTAHERVQLHVISTCNMIGECLQRWAQVAQCLHNFACALDLRLHIDGCSLHTSYEQ